MVGFRNKAKSRQEQLTFKSSYDHRMIPFPQLAFQVDKGAVDVVLVHGDLGFQSHIEVVREEPHASSNSTDIRLPLFEAVVGHGERSFFRLGSIEAINESSSGQQGLRFDRRSTLPG